MCFGKKIKNKKRYNKVMVLILVLTVLASEIALWCNFVGVSNVVEAISAVRADTYNAKSSFYNYYYDNQITSGGSTINQGEETHPFLIFNLLVAQTDYANSGMITVTSSITSRFTLELNGWAMDPSTLSVHIWNDNGLVITEVLTKTSAFHWNCDLSYNTVSSIQKSIDAGRTVYFKFVANYGITGSEVWLESESGGISALELGKQYDCVRNNSDYDVSCSESSYSGTVDNVKSTAIPLYFGAFYENIAFNDATAASINTLMGESLVNFYWAANLALRPLSAEDSGATVTPQFYTAVQNLTDVALSEDGIPQKNGENLPYFDEEWLTTTKYNGNSIANVISDVDFTFYKSTVGLSAAASNFLLLAARGDTDKLDGTYYTYDSSKDVFKVNENGIFVYMHNVPDAEKVKYIQELAGFLPFNDAGVAKSNLQYGFGTQIEIDFNLSEDGKIDGDDMVFAFKGDDDLWTFIDDVLMLDMGGAHKQAEGYIDFATGEIVVAKAHDAYFNDIACSEDSVGASVTTIAAMFDKASLSNTFEQTDGIYDSEITHTVKIFFMERGILL